MPSIEFICGSSGQLKLYNQSSRVSSSPRKVGTRRLARYTKNPSYGSDPTTARREGTSAAICVIIVKRYYQQDYQVTEKKGSICYTRLEVNAELRPNCTQVKV